MYCTTPCLNIFVVSCQRRTKSIHHCEWRKWCRKDCQCQICNEIFCCSWWLRIRNTCREEGTRFESCYGGKMLRTTTNDARMERVSSLLQPLQAFISVKTTCSLLLRANCLSCVKVYITIRFPAWKIRCTYLQLQLTAHGMTRNSHANFYDKRKKGLFESQQKHMIFRCLNDR